MLLEIKNLVVTYGKALALNDISIEVKEGSAVAIIGPNGAGKTTLLRSVSGLVFPASGEIWFSGKRIDTLPPYERVKLGVVQVPEGRKLFPHLTVLENLLLGATTRKDKDGINKDLGYVFELFPRLKERMKQKAGTLSGGEQQMLAVGRGLMARPKLLMLDEPSLGLAPQLVQQLTPVIRNINKQGTGILLVEQNASLAFKACELCYVLRLGRIVLKGRSEELKESDALKLAYLGGEGY